MIDKNLIKNAVYEAIPATAIDQIIVFGSYARGDYTKDSDTDICIIVKEPLDKEKIKSYRGQLNKIFALKHRMPTDILIKSSYDFDRYKNVPGAIEYSIAAEGVII
jgi:predicted nucleotidyltransferase